MDVSCIHIELSAKEIFDPCSVQNGSDTHDAVLGNLDIFQRRIGQDVDRVRDDQEDRLCIALCDLGDNRFEDIYILADEIHTCIALDPRFARRNNDDSCVGQIIVSAAVDIHRFYERNAVRQIQRYTLCLAGKRIDQDHFRKQSALHQRKADSRTGTAASDDCHFSHIHCHCI